MASDLSARLRSHTVRTQPLGVCYEWALRKRREDVVGALDLVLTWRHSGKAFGWLLWRFGKLAPITIERTLSLIEEPPDLDGMTREKLTIRRSTVDGTGLKPKYVVRRLNEDGGEGEPIEGCFVLKPASDPAALIAMKIYAENCHDDLHDRIVAEVELIESRATMELSDTGEANLPYLGGTLVRR